MNWDDLRIFLALCREGSLTCAAEVLAVNHTTVARRIKALETGLRTRLFDRTHAGYAMAQAAENLFDQALAMEAQALPAFQARYPGIELELLTTTDIVDLAAREADLAVRLTPRPPEYLVGRRLLPLRHGIYASPDYLKQASSAGDVILFRTEREAPEWVAQNFPDARVPRVFGAHHQRPSTADSRSTVALRALAHGCLESANVPAPTERVVPLGTGFSAPCF